MVLRTHDLPSVYRQHIAALWQQENIYLVMVEKRNGIIILTLTKKGRLESTFCPDKIGSRHFPRFHSLRKNVDK